mmetsp:Transcript_10409/g.17675  ORF Transcript_10409/g.17675 Transcript_10409/m.17675 type:complete len:119 (+) Transcript_10409:3647-4003(+)
MRGSIARLTSAGVASESICCDILFCEVSSPSSSSDDEEYASISKSTTSSVLQASYPSCGVLCNAVDLEEDVIRGVVIVVIIGGEITAWRIGELHARQQQGSTNVDSNDIIFIFVDVGK